MLDSLRPSISSNILSISLTHVSQIAQIEPLTTRVRNSSANRSLWWQAGILLLLIGSLLFLCLGILGEYLGVVIKEVKRRPIAIVDSHFGFSRSPAKSRLILEARDQDQF